MKCTTAVMGKWPGAEETGVNANSEHLGPRRRKEAAGRASWQAEAAGETAQLRPRRRKEA